MRSVSMTRQELLKGEDVHDEVGVLIQQDQMATDENVDTIRRRRRQAAFQFDGHSVVALLQTRWQRTVAD